MRSTKSPRHKTASATKTREINPPADAGTGSARTAAAGRRARLVAGEELGETKARILDATFRRLATQGYAALRVRDIAEEAGVNVALINYYFATKDQLVIEVLDAANERLLARQKAMYRGPQGFAEKWAEARRFYESDLASGFVRVQAELMAAAYSNPWLRDRVAARVVAWTEPIHETVREVLSELAAQDIEVPDELTAGVITNWIGNFWIGMEIGDLLGGWSVPRGSNAEALDAMQHLLEGLDVLVNERKGVKRTGRRSAEKKEAR